ncbi:hypothetical protein [Sporosarcina sp. FA9]
MNTIKWLNRYFLDEDEEIATSDFVWWYGIFGGSVFLGIIVCVVTL